jgi:hypothetical protein
MASVGRLRTARRTARQQHGRLSLASILLRVRFPPEYPQAAPPEVSVEDSMVTTQAPLPQNKVLATLAILDEGGLVCGFLARAAECLPGPCVYEAATWLTENAFDFVGQAWIPAT